MLDNPFETKNKNKTSTKNAVDLSRELDFSMLKENKEESILDVNSLDYSMEENEFTFDFEDNSKYEYTPSFKQTRLAKRSVEEELADEQYHERLKELNANAENKHYVLFFGQPASGKTWIIGSLLHYMKNYLGGMVHLDPSKSTDAEEELFYLLQDRFNGVTHAEKITSTDKHQYFEFHISFTPKDTTKPPMDIVFVDASGEHSELGFRNKNNAQSGKLPNYLTVILESNVNTKIAFVYDQSLQDERGSIPQTNVLNAVFTHIQQIQLSQKKQFPKALLLSKADRIYANDFAAVERNGYSAEHYALEKIPSFANSFFNESPENKTIFYKMGTFSINSDLLLEFDKECPEKLFNWFYKEGTGDSVIPELTCWDKFKRWFKGE